MLKTVLVNLPVDDLEDDSMQPPIGLVSIATYAAMNGYEMEVCDLSGNRGIDLNSLIPKADVYGFSTYSVTYKKALEVVEKIRLTDPQAYIIAGGPHASALPEKVKEDFDCVIVGEGEKVFCEILENLKNGTKDRIPGIIKAEPIKDLDSLPFPDYYRFCDLSKYSRCINGVPAMAIDTSRGCNFKCSFCNSIVFQRGTWRARSADNVVREIELHYSNGWRAFRFNDDNFLVSQERAAKICERIAPLNIAFRIFARAESLNDNICRKLKEAGCEHISVGVESLSPRMLSLMGKASTVERIKSGLQAAKKAGISTRGFFICGFPGETDETLDESVDSLEDIALDEAIVYPCIPYPGTPLYTERDKYGITWIEEDFSKYLQVGINKKAGFVMATDSFGPEKIVEWRNKYMEKFEQVGISWAGHGEIK